MDNQFIAFPVPEVNGRRLSEITNNIQPPSYEESLVPSPSTMSYTDNHTDFSPSTSTLRSTRSFRNTHPPPPVPARPQQYHSISQINQASSVNGRYTDTVLERNVQPLKINKRDSFRPQPPTPLSPAISNNHSLNDNSSLSPPSIARRPTQPHSRTSSVFSMESRVEPFYSRQSDDEHDAHDAMYNKLTIEEQEDQDLSQAIEISKMETSQPFAYDDIDHSTVSSNTHNGGPSMESHQSYSTADTSAYNPSGGPYSWVNPSDVTWNQEESTFVKKERMRQHLENHNLKKWQTEMEDVTSEWHNLVNEETLQAFDKAEIARQRWV